MVEDPTSEAFFEAKYRASTDPWEFGSSEYEQNRYAEIIKSLGDRRYHRAFEPGCSVGILTERLAQICDQVEAADISSTAVLRAQNRCKRFPGVSIRQGAFPNDLPEGSFDLIVLSEIAYYLNAPVLSDVTNQLAGRLEKDGVFLAVHWLGTSKDHILTGDQVHQILLETLKLDHVAGKRYDGYRIDHWLKR